MSHIARLDLGVVLDHDVGAHGQVVLLHLLALLVDDADDRVLGLVLGLDDHLLRKDPSARRARRGR